MLFFTHLYLQFWLSFPASPGIHLARLPLQAGRRSEGMEMAWVWVGWGGSFHYGDEDGTS